MTVAQIAKAMTGTNHNLLITTDVVDNRSVRTLSTYSKAYELADLAEDRLNEILSSIDCLVVVSWPTQHTGDGLLRMSSLRFFQMIVAGVNDTSLYTLS